MVRKTISKDKTTTTDKDKTQADVVAKKEPLSDSEKTSTTKDDNKIPDNYKILIKALAYKISPKSEGEIGFELVKDETGILYLRLTSNTSSGNFCKTPVLLQTVVDILAAQNVVNPFTSKILKDVFQGKGSKNSNNTSFLMAALRSKELLLAVPDTDKPTSSRLHKDFTANSKRLLAMK